VADCASACFERQGIPSSNPSTRCFLSELSRAACCVRQGSGRRAGAVFSESCVPRSANMKYGFREATERFETSLCLISIASWNPYSVLAVDAVFSESSVSRSDCPSPSRHCMYSASCVRKRVTGRSQTARLLPQFHALPSRPGRPLHSLARGRKWRNWPGVPLQPPCFLGIEHC
jgi:hypothetical protein